MIIPLRPPTRLPTQTKIIVSSVSRKTVRSTFMSDLVGPDARPGADRETTGAGGLASRIPTDAAARLGARRRRVPLAHGALDLLTLPDPDALLDGLTQEQFDANDGRMPYWATLWASAHALADEVLAGPSVAGHGVLDLGCGLGLCGLAALERGARVTFLDWEPDAVSLARASAWAAGHSCEAVACDWRSPPSLAPFDLVLAADVLYEPRNAPAVARFLARHLAAEGVAVVVDPGRLHAARFEGDLADAGLRVLERKPL